ncbi:MAG TPA: hypothetical protein GXX57_01390 [Firmicutes bacterium]|nr:hypothetical protein [Bacillota bacterium]
MELIRQFLGEVRTELTSANTAKRAAYGEIERLLVELCRQESTQIKNTVIHEIWQLCRTTPLGKDVRYEYSKGHDPCSGILTGEQTSLFDLKPTVPKPLAAQLPQPHTLPNLAQIDEEQLIKLLEQVLHHKSYYYTKTEVSPLERSTILLKAQILLRLYQELTAVETAADAG